MIPSISHHPNSETALFIIPLLSILSLQEENHEYVFALFQSQSREHRGNDSVTNVLSSSRYQLKIQEPEPQ